jgi:hypothetical protein
MLHYKGERCTLPKSDSMDAKKIFQPKIWYIICGAMAMLGGIENNMNAEKWADSAWGAAGVNDQSLAMEMLFGLFMIGFGVMSFVTAYVLEGESIAKFAMFNGAAMIAFFVIMFFMLPTSGYALPGVGWLLPPLVLIGGLITSGYLHSREEAAPAGDA